MPGGSRFVTFSCYRRLALLSEPGVGELVAEALQAARARHGLRLYAWVAMPEHAHLLVCPREGSTLSAVLRSIKTSSAKRAIQGWRASRALALARTTNSDGSPRFWQPGGGFDRNVRDEAEFCRAVRYIHRNPVERGLVSRPQDWAFSSVRWWMGLRDGEMPCDDPPGRPGSWSGWKGYV